MSDPRHLPPEYSTSGDPLVSLTNLAAVRDRMDSLHHFLVDSVNRNTLLPHHQMDRVSSELTSAIHQVIVNGAALLSFSQSQPQPHQIRPALPDRAPTQSKPEPPDSVPEDSDKEDDQMEDLEIVEMDAVELLAEHIHFCEICGKGFKRDANLRMHMRAHGNQFKTLEALSKPEKSATTAGSTDLGGASGGGGRRRRLTRFSCPYVGCNRNQQHKSFRPLKSVICVKNHFKRSHCPKMYSCNRCHKKSFSVVADLKNHLKHCGDARWRCSCGTTFSRKDKLFGHMALFEGHMPAVGPADVDDDDNKSRVEAARMVVDLPENAVTGGGDRCKISGNNFGDELSFEGLMEGFGSIENQCLQGTMAGGSSSGGDWNMSIMMDEYFNF